MSSGLERDTKGRKVAMGRDGSRSMRVWSVLFRHGKEVQPDRNAGAVGRLVGYLTGTQ